MSDLAVGLILGGPAWLVVLAALLGASEGVQALRRRWRKSPPERVRRDRIRRLDRLEKRASDLRRLVSE